MVDLEHFSLGYLGLLKMMVENTPLLIYGLLKIMVDLVNYLVENTPLVLHGLLGMMIVSVQIAPLIIYD